MAFTYNLKFSLGIYVAILGFACFATPEYCKIPTRLELVFLVDNSDSYPVEKIKDIVLIADTLSIKYPGSKFGLALYSDFECLAWNVPKSCEVVITVIRKILKTLHNFKSLIF